MDEDEILPAEMVLESIENSTNLVIPRSARTLRRVTQIIQEKSDAEGELRSNSVTFNCRFVVSTLIMTNVILSV